MRLKRVAGVLVLMSALVAGVFVVAPPLVSKIVYAAGAGEAQVAHEQLQQANAISQAFQNVAKAVRPSVVSVTSVKKATPIRTHGRAMPDTNGLQEFFGDDLNRFLQRRGFDGSAGPGGPGGMGGMEQRGLGTGVIVSPDGYVLTNNHVVDGADTVSVKLFTGKTLAAKVVGADAKTDVAVLKVDANELSAAHLGDSDKLEVGEWAIAVGSPMGLEQTVTAGIISAKGRSNMGIADYEDFLQTDAAINPGNSGGPLVNLKGEVIGINTAIASRSGGNMGIGFAIPINMAREIMDKLISKGHVDRGWLGVGIQNLSEDLARSFKFEGTDGVLVSDVTKAGPAEKGGLKSGDIVTRFDGRKIEHVNQLRNLVASEAPGKKVEVEVYREGATQKLSIELGRMDETAAEGGGKAEAEELGLTLENLGGENGARRYADRGTRGRGVRVAEVEPGSIADRAGLAQGNVIVSVGRRPVNSVEDFQDEMARQDLSQGVRLQVRADEMLRYVFLKSEK
ncbi:MAG: DegQ family serine endoprotease [Planctomycetota bacterium]|nr:DegQ family serine endoprotease [Planctomycetota bacterium]